MGCKWTIIDDPTFVLVCSMQSIQNLGLAVVSILAGAILDARGYILLEVFFLVLLCGALITGVILYMWDAAKGK